MIDREDANRLLGGLSSILNIANTLRGLDAVGINGKDVFHKSSEHWKLYRQEGEGWNESSIPFTFDYLNDGKYWLTSEAILESLELSAAAYSSLRNFPIVNGAFEDAIRLIKARSTIGASRTEVEALRAMSSVEKLIPFIYQYNRKMNTTKEAIMTITGEDKTSIRAEVKLEYYPDTFVSSLVDYANMGFYEALSWIYGIETHAQLETEVVESGKKKITTPGNSSVISLVFQKRNEQERQAQFRYEHELGLEYYRTKAVDHLEAAVVNKLLQRKLVEETSERESFQIAAAQNNLLRGLSHHLRTPLATIDSMLSLLTHANDTPQIYSESYDDIKTILPYSQAAIARIRETLDLFFEGYKGTGITNTYNIVERVWNICDANHKSLAIQFKNNVPVDFSLDMPPSILSTIVNVIVENALDFMKKNDSMTVYTHNQELFFDNTGTSISPSILERIGVERVTSRELHSGYGLWSATQLAKKNHYDLRIENFEQGVRVRLSKGGHYGT